jgi:murein DD-endopeptidase MepM/ murein hydrolase activator NlpD
VPGIKEGPVVLRVVARDASLWHWGAGNETILEKKLAVDVTPPTLELVADDRYINFGGVGAIVYRSSADTASSGVKVGSHFFPGFEGVVKGHPDYRFALFSHAYDVRPTDRATLVATDKAGNTAEMRLSYELKNVKYKKSTIAVSDSFFQNKVVPLLKDVSKRGGSVKDVFVAVDKGVRKDNEDKIAEVTSKTTPRILWSGAFAQLSNSKVEANFADERTYTYNGAPIDTAFHLGYDLSVTKHYPIEAANSGVVAFTGDLGLYGNAIIIDHGLGLYTLYGHCSQVDVKPGDAITKRQIIGKTGETGFAGGDHLHFGVYLDGVAVLPVEWWDAKWIDDNVTPKLEGRSGEEIAEAQRPVHRASHKRRH